MKKLSALLFDPAHLVALLVTFQVTSVVADSLWKADTSPSSMFADKKARRVGDIVTIVVQQNTGATRNNNTTTAKQTSVDASIASFLYGPGASGLLTKGGAVSRHEFRRQKHLCRRRPDQQCRNHHRPNRRAGH